MSGKDKSVEICQTIIVENMRSVGNNVIKIFVGEYGTATEKTFYTIEYIQ